MGMKIEIIGKKRIEIIGKKRIEDLPENTILSEVRVHYKQKNPFREGQRVLLFGKVVSENGHKGLFEVDENGEKINEEVFDEVERVFYIIRV